MPKKEATARIKINRLLEHAGWRFFDDENGKANISLESNITITKKYLNELGADFEKLANGFVDFLLLGPDGFPLAVLEAKNEGKAPLDGKEQARRYTDNQNARFVILSNGNLHYFWDLNSGNPEIITELPTQESLMHRLDFKPNNQQLAEAEINQYYIAETQESTIQHSQIHEAEGYYAAHPELQILRSYQLNAIHALQDSAKSGHTRFLFEMATGTGKTLISTAVIKLFLRTGNARRVLFLVDRLELEAQAHKTFSSYLKNDYRSVIYKHNLDNWRSAEIVISTVQSLSSQHKYRKIFSPTDFNLLIADESHRAINGNARAVFEYFIGYKLGLTATPKDYLRNIDHEKITANDPRVWERRQLLDTYTTFGCANSDPTFRYSLVDGVKGEYLINPIVVDARTEITTELLSEKGYAVMIKNDEGEMLTQSFFQKDFERKFFSEKSNRVFCTAFLEHALKDPISGEVGKSIIFCVSQNHATKITQVLNQLARKIWVDKYQSDFAVQITSNIPNAQQFSISFANNNLNGQSKFLPSYKSSKTRVCVTVGMMTTGYDCRDILNLILLRPIFSPTDFVQIKGRGTRKFTFQYTDANNETHQHEKQHFKLFDFFANCEYFEETFNYDEVLELLHPANGIGKKKEGVNIDLLEVFEPDQIKSMSEAEVGTDGMKIDRKLFEKAREQLQQDDAVKTAVEHEQWDEAVAIIRKCYENKPELYLTLDKIRKSENLDRRLTWREFLERVFGLINEFKPKDEKLEGEVQEFIAIHKPNIEHVPHIRNFLKAYVVDGNFRNIINNKEYAKLNVDVGFTVDEFKSLGHWREIIPEYVKDHIAINTYMD